MEAGLLSFSLLSLLPSSNLHAQQVEPSTAVHASQSDSTQQSNTESLTSKGEHIVEGIVVDEDNQPFEGVAVAIKGTNIGQLTDHEGKFKFSNPLKSGNVLYFFYVGMVTKEIDISKKAPSFHTIRLKYDLCDIMGEVSHNQVYASKPSFWQKLTGIFR